MYIKSKYTNDRIEVLSRFELGTSRWYAITILPFHLIWNKWGDYYIYYFIYSKYFAKIKFQYYYLSHIMSKWKKKKEKELHCRRVFQDVHIFYI
jgi:hypothetical protein